jgi:hypothetical protein
VVDEAVDGVSEVVGAFEVVEVDVDDEVDGDVIEANVVEVGIVRVVDAVVAVSGTSPVFVAFEGAVPKKDPNSESISSIDMRVEE